METKFTEDDLLKVIIALETMGIYLSIPISGGTANGKRITGFSTTTLLNSTLVTKDSKWYLRISTDDNSNIDTGPYDDVLVACILKPFFDALNKYSLAKVPVTNKLNQFVQQQLKNDEQCKTLFTEFEKRYLEKRLAVVTLQYETAAYRRDQERVIIQKIIDRLTIIISEKKKRLNMKFFNENMIISAIDPQKIINATTI